VKQLRVRAEQASLDQVWKQKAEKCVWSVRLIDIFSSSSTKHQPKIRWDVGPPCVYASELTLTGHPWSLSYNVTNIVCETHCVRRQRKGKRTQKVLRKERNTVDVYVCDQCVKKCMCENRREGYGHEHRSMVLTWESKIDELLIGSSCQFFSLFSFGHSVTSHIS